MLAMGPIWQHEVANQRMKACQMLNAERRCTSNAWQVVISFRITRNLHCDRTTWWVWWRFWLGKAHGRFSHPPNRSGGPIPSRSAVLYSVIIGPHLSWPMLWGRDWRTGSALHVWQKSPLELPSRNRHYVFTWFKNKSSWADLVNHLNGAQEFVLLELSKDWLMTW